MKALILCGGSGTRLWPISRELFPKQFITLPHGKSLLQNTYQRVFQLPALSEIITVTNQNYFFFTKDEYQALGNALPNTYFLEPFGRNTAAPIALVALYVLAQKQEEELLVLPADHMIANVNEFVTKVETAKRFVQDGHIITFGITPTAPKVGYGYIHAGKEIASQIFSVEQFVEKPSLEKAQKFLMAGNYFWNSGMFFFKASTIIEAFKKHAPQLLEAVENVWQHIQQETIVAQNCFTITENTFAPVENISIDYALLEHAKKQVVVAMDCEWSDVGSWNEFSQMYSQDSSGNKINNDAILVDVKNTFIHAQKNKIVAAVGVEDLMVVDTHDALLVAHNACSEDIKKVVSQLKEKNHDAFKIHQTVKRPWGEYTVLEESENYKIKRIVVNPKASLSLQYHHHRSEHWVVVDGEAKVINGEQEILLKTSESTFITKGAQHRLANPSDTVHLVIIEVQVGHYLGEDDIVRLEDHYGRHDRAKML